MGSQTLEILRQGVWASLTGGWFYDPHQGVFCNVVHLYLWLFLLCLPFVAYLYFPSTWLTWCIYCVLTSLTILAVKLVNMALHRLYDRAQTMSEANLKNSFFKITKETEPREDETGIEMKVMRNEKRHSVNHALHEASEENSIISMENVNSFIDLKVDVHRKNSSESIEMMFYAPSVVSGNSQQDQQSLAGSASVTKSIRSSHANASGSNNNNSSLLSEVAAHSTAAKYLSVYPEHESELSKGSPSAGSGGSTSAAASGITSNRHGAPHLVRKSSEELKRTRMRRLARQCSVDAAAETSSSNKLMRNQSDTIAVTARSEYASFLHPHSNSQAAAGSFGKSSSASKVNGNVLTAGGGSANSNSVQRTATTSQAVSQAATTNMHNSVKGARLQRHRSSETHEERMKQQNRCLYLPIHIEQQQHHQHHPASGASSSSALTGMTNDADELQLGLGGSASGVDNCARTLQSWILGSEVYIEDDSCTKSDFGIEQLDGRNANRAAYLLQPQQPINSHYPYQQPLLRGPHHHHHHHHGGANIRKDSNSTMSALQLPIASSSLSGNSKGGASGSAGISGGNSGGGMKRRRHSNATALFKSSNASSAATAAAAAALASSQQPTVRRIKSTALETSCPRPSVSNLSPHPNSVEAINGQQQIKNPQSALLPPPSKCLVRNPHLNLCPKFGDSFGGSGGSLNFGASTSGSTTPLIELVYPIAEQADEKTAVDVSKAANASDDLEITDIEIEDEDGAAGATGGAVEVPVGEMDDVDDEVDDVPVRRRHKALGCQHHSADSDVGDILADDDDDEFKDFDDDLEQSLSAEMKNQTAPAIAAESVEDFDHILSGLEQIQNDLKLSRSDYNRKAHVYAADSDNEESCERHKRGQQQRLSKRTRSPAAEDDEEPSTSQAMRQRLHSTDSETDNNGSRSPLLNTKMWGESNNTEAQEAEKRMYMEIAAIQKYKSAGSVLPQHLFEVRPQHVKGEGDSGCPSSDCEQVSASSKDMLLSGMEAVATSSSMVGSKTKPTKREANEEPIAKGKDVEEGLENGKNHESTTVATVANTKSLGAIPKVVKYREVDETHGGGARETAASGSQMHKRRINNGSNADMSVAPLSLPANNSNMNSTSKALSRTSSSTSSRSVSADSCSTDVPKILWLMPNTSVDDMGRSHGYAGGEATPVASGASVMPSNVPTAHYHLYQEALQALNQYSATSTDGLSPSDRIYFRDKQRRNSKQISEPGNSSFGEISHSHELQSARLRSTCERSGHPHPPIGVVLASSSLNARNISNAATLSIQGLINVINDGRQLSQARDGARSGTPVAAILNVDGHHIENYCDYWRPACMLSAEKPTAPKSFYKYRFKCFGYEHEFKICMDRLELLALFDRDLHWLHVVLSVMLCAGVAYLGATILQLSYYKDLCAFLFCAVIASAQYSLVKSVQPDAASPIHGFNKTVAYSRAIYFCLCGGLLLLFEQLKTDYEQRQPPPAELSFFGIQYSPLELTRALTQFMYMFLLFFPVIFSLGLFPQINTFLMYLLEQIDMHVFGGNAAGSLLGSFLCVLRSILGVMLLYGPLYSALAEGKGTQFIVFSIFCAILVPLGYHLSRSASDFSHLWALIKHCIVSTYRDDDDELSGATVGSAASSQKLATSSASATKRAKNSVESVGVAPTASTENIEMCSLDKLPAPYTATEQEDEHTNLERKSSKSKASSLGSSSQTLGKTMSGSKRAMTGSNSYASIAGGSSSVAGGGDAGLDMSNEVHSGRMPELIAGDETAAGVQKLSQEPNAVREANTEAEVENEDELDKLSSSSTTNPGDMSTLTAGGGCGEGATGTGGSGLSENDPDSADPLPRKLQNTVNMRLKNDLVVTTLLAVIVLGLHCSTVFTVLQPDLNIVLYAFTGALGLLLHYIIPQMRKHMPWLCFAKPLLRQREFGKFEVSHAPKVMWFEKVYIYLCMLERNVLFPLLVISALTADAQLIANKFGIGWGTLIVSVCALKLIRNAYSDSANQYLIIMFTVLFFRYDFALASETFLIDYFFVSLAYRKCCDFLLKLQFIVTYIAPWQITWGSAFHAFAQPFSVPHSAMLFLQAAVSAALSTPLNPFLGSAIFLTSYVRPIKFWERDYNTRRIDHSNTRLSSQLERDLGADDNNLNSIFYEHLTRSLQHSLCGDLLMGRWGSVNQGDCFVLASDYLNCLVHIIELGNGLCTFQMRGLEFRGTYCQQREVEAITEDVEDNDGCCCCDPGHLPRMLSVNAMFSTRWLAWQVVAAQYVLEGYSISDNLASATLQVFEYRKVLITYYIKSIIYYVIKNPKLEEWLASGPIQEALQHTLCRQFVDLDPIFNFNLDEDFDFRAIGITRASFCYVYLSWINYCYDKRKESQNPPASANAPTTAPHTPTTNTYNDSKSTPNLSTATTGQAAKSQSQQQLRTRPQKSATMSGSATINSTEHIPISQSFANISRQTSESAPGLSGVGLTLGGCYTSSMVQTPQDSSLNNSVSGAKLTPLGQQFRGANSKATTPNKLLRKEASPTASAAGNAHSGVGSGTPIGMSSRGPSGERAASEETTRERLTMKLKVLSIAKDSPIVSLCLALGLLARRSLANASHSSLTGVEFFLHGLHQLFKGDFRIQSPRDEWVFADMELLHSVVAPAVKMALKLQQDHISNPDEFRCPDALYEAIDTCAKDLVISHEADPVWRSAVLRGAPNLLALRHVIEDGSDEYRIIRLTKRFLSFRVIKLNRECVRGLWAGQQQELIYLRNRNPERGSIQNAKQALRNIINSSCDQPIGYPIYVSPLTTSYADTNEQLCKVIGGAITLESIKSNVLDWWHRIRERCRQGCSSGSAMETSNLGVAGLGAGPVLSAGSESGETAPVYISAPLYNTLTVTNFSLRSTGTVPSSIGTLSSTLRNDGIVPIRRGPIITVKPALLTGLLCREREREQERERELDRERGRERDLRGMGIRKSHTMSRADRERRVTLPIASTSMGVVSGGSSSSGSAAAGMSKMGAGVGESGSIAPQERQTELQVSSSPRYTKISSSSGSLGIGNIITTPGDYPRKSKGPICLTAASAAAASEAARTAGNPDVAAGQSTRLPTIGMGKRAIIVDDFEIFDRFDSGHRIDVVWPSEEMRAKGSRTAWKDWVPCIGMVGLVVHWWMPNHEAPRFRSPFNRVLYLLKIDDYYVPISELGVFEYKVARQKASRHNEEYSDDEEEDEEKDDEIAMPLAALENLISRSRSMHHELYGELDDLQMGNRPPRREGLTPILGSSLESPTSHLVASMSGGAEGLETYTDEELMTGTAAGVSAMTASGSGAKPKIRAVSSSSSEDEAELLGYEMQRREMLQNVWKMMAQRKEASEAQSKEQEETNKVLDESKDNEEILEIKQQMEEEWKDREKNKSKDEESHMGKEERLETSHIEAQKAELIMLPEASEEGETLTVEEGEEVTPSKVPDEQNASDA